MKKRLLCFIIAILLVISAMALRISRYYSITCDLYAGNGIKGEITQDIYQKLADYPQMSSIKYEQISKILYDSNGKVSTITVDTTLLNAIAAEIANLIYDCIVSSQHRFGIPFGNMLGSSYLSGKGPKLDIKILPIGAVEFDIKTEMLDGGINQTIHRISISFDIDINCIAPFHKSISNINTTIIIAETLIIGEIPNTILSALG